MAECTKGDRGGVGQSDIENGDVVDDWGGDGGDEEEDGGSEQEERADMVEDSGLSHFDC